MANAIKCGKCGASLALVGLAHRCIERTPVQQDLIYVTAKVTVSPSSTYQYRDPGKRRAYMRDYMRKKRVK